MKTLDRNQVESSRHVKVVGGISSKNKDPLENVMTLSQYSELCDLADEIFQKKK